MLFVRLFDLDLSISSSSWCLGRAAVCDYGTPWTFLLPFFRFVALVANVLWLWLPLGVESRLFV